MVITTIRPQTIENFYKARQLYNIVKRKLQINDKYLSKNRLLNAFANFKEYFEIFLHLENSVPMWKLQ